MELQPYRPTASFEEISAQVAFLRTSYDIRVPLRETEGLEELLGVSQRNSSYLRSRVMTGYRSRQEQLDCLENEDEFLDLKEMVLCKLAYEEYELTHDTGNVSRMLGQKIQAMEIETQADDYEERFRSSGIENIKLKVAQRPIASRVVPPGIGTVATFGAGFMATSFLKDSTEAQVSAIESTLLQGRWLGALAIAAAIGVGAAKKHGPRRIGGFLGSRVQASWKVYNLERHVLKDIKKLLLPRKDILKMYAERDLKSTIHEVKAFLNDFPMEGAEDIVHMVKGAQKITEISMLERYNIDLEEPAWQQWLSQLPGDNLDAGISFKDI